MKVSLKTFMPMAAAGLLALGACCNVKSRAEKYMADRPYSDYLQVVDEDNYTLIQSRLDSVAYRDIFNSTSAAKDSACVAEFNSIAASLRGYEGSIEQSSRIPHIKANLAKQGITLRELENIKTLTGWVLDVSGVNRFQYFADDWAYRKFFEKIGVMDDNVAKQCDDVFKKIAAQN